MNNKPVLYTIKYSNFNEKVRFALAYYGVDYREKAYLPFFHMLPVLWITRGAGIADKTSSKLSTPVLKTAEGRCLTQSTVIMQYIAKAYSNGKPTLYPDEDVIEFEKQLDEGLGVEARRFAYYQLLFQRKLLRKMVFKNASKTQAVFYTLLQIPFEKLFVKLFHLTPERIKRSEETIAKVFAEVEARLADGRPYLMGDSLTAADITFACHAAPVLVLQPEEGYGAWFPSLAECPEAFAHYAKQLRETPAGQFAIRIFQEKLR